jgi:CBS-domain-containing membrane protein
MSWLQKLQASTTSPPRVSAREMAWSWLASLAGMGLLALVHHLWFAGTSLPLMFGPLGASSVLIHGAPKSPLAQPRNLLGGHIISALVGVAAYQILPSQPHLAAPLAVATSIALMHLTKTLHPPGGATALIAVIGDDNIHALGFTYLLFPAGLGALILLLTALAFNNLLPGRRYPEFWK